MHRQPTDGRDDRVQSPNMRLSVVSSDDAGGGVTIGAVAVGIVAVLAAWHLAGCAISSAENRLRPELAVKKDFRQALLERYRRIDTIMGFYQTGAWSYLGETNRELSSIVTDETERRNIIAYDLIFLINEFYDAYELSWFSGVQTGNVVGDLLSLGTSTAGAVAGGEGVKTMLAAITAGVIGGKRSFEKHFLADQSISLIIFNMRKGRQGKLRQIRETLSKTTDSEYRLQEVLIDLQEFYYAGTVLGAIQAILGQDLNSMKASYEKLSAADQARIERSLAIIAEAQTEQSKQAARSAAASWVEIVQSNWAQAMLKADADFRTRNAEANLNIVKDRAALSERLGKGNYEAARFTAGEAEYLDGVLFRDVVTVVTVGATKVSERVRLKRQGDGDWKVVEYAFSLPEAKPDEGS